MSAGDLQFFWGEGTCQDDLVGGYCVCVGGGGACGRGGGGACPRVLGALWPAVAKGRGRCSSNAHKRLGPVTHVVHG